MLPGARCSWASFWSSFWSSKCCSQILGKLYRPAFISSPNPRYKKTGASTMIRLGFHRSLTGGVASRPRLPQTDLALQVLSEYSSLPGQPYPLNVRVPFQPKLDSALFSDFGPADIPFANRHNLYQRVRKCLRNKTCLSTISLDP